MALHKKSANLVERGLSLREAMTYLADRAIAPPGQEGWTRHQEKYREASFDGADGVVVQDQTEMFLNLNHHPVCAASDASHFLLTGAATPPGQEGRWPGPPSMLLPPSIAATFVDKSCYGNLLNAESENDPGVHRCRPRQGRERPFLGSIERRCVHLLELRLHNGGLRDLPIWSDRDSNGHVAHR